MYLNGTSVTLGKGKGGLTLTWDVFKSNIFKVFYNFIYD